MSRFMESLESRHFLSVTLPALMPVPTAAPKTAALTSTVVSAKVGVYQGAATLDSKGAKLWLKITSIKGTAVIGSLYSGDWGGFNVPVTGTLSSGKTVKLSGASSTCRVSNFTATLGTDGKTLSGTCSLTQMGISMTGSAKVIRITTPSAVVAPKVASLLGRYLGKASDGSSVALTFTKQSGGLIWGKDQHGQAVTGVIMAGNQIHLIIKETDGWTDIKGTMNTTGSAGTGTWKWHGKDGDSESGTWALKRG